MMNFDVHKDKTINKRNYVKASMIPQIRTSDLFLTHDNTKKKEKFNMS